MRMVHMFPSIISETRCSRISEMREENVVERRHARNINESQSEDTRIDSKLVGNCGTVFYKHA